MKKKENMKKQERFHFTNLFNRVRGIVVVSIKHNSKESVVFLLFPFSLYSVTPSSYFPRCSVPADFLHVLWAKLALRRASAISVDSL